MRGRGGGRGMLYRCEAGVGLLVVRGELRVRVGLGMRMGLRERGGGTNEVSCIAKILQKDN